MNNCEENLKAEFKVDDHLEISMNTFWYLLMAIFLHIFKNIEYIEFFHLLFVFVCLFFRNSHGGIRMRWNFCLCH
jgi:hypothetical protein